MEKIIQYYNKLEEYILIGSLVFLVFLLFTQVVLRYVFNSSLSWAEELARYIFVWQVWLGISIGEKDHKHIRLDLLTQFFREKRGVNYIIEIMDSIILLAFLIFLSIEGTRMVLLLIHAHSLSASMRLPMYIVYLALPVSAIITFFRLLREIYKKIIIFPSKIRGKK